MVKREGNDFAFTGKIEDEILSIAAVSEGLGLSFCPEILAKKAKRTGLVDIVRISDAESAAYSICALKGERMQNSATNGFWKYLTIVSKRFRGNLPCIFRITYP